MRICDHHRDEIRTVLWQHGVKPSQDGAEAAARGRISGDPYTDAQGLLLANFAKEFPGSAVNSPASLCPLCARPDLAGKWIAQACTSSEAKALLPHEKPKPE